MNKLKKQLISQVEKLLGLKGFEMLKLVSYKNKNNAKASSIFGFEARDVASLPQEAKDIIITGRKLGLDASYSAPDINNDEGSIYLGPSTDDKTVGDKLDFI